MTHEEWDDVALALIGYKNIEIERLLDATYEGELLVDKVREIRRVHQLISKAIDNQFKEEL